MNTIFFGILTILSLFIFMNLGKIKASKKQMNRDDRINWGRKQRPNVQNTRDGSKIIDGEAEEINDETQK
ncbi:hypothetical protein N9W10_02810 [Gammaproteobacteria bacterium]|jgi:hypothetical protein|nr:hypothetical protein [Gammaproteobacteria bacterium]MDB2357078.1 hypothetical protein [Gammaproteobacteria bacterium]MDB2510799.1 hypothetical protein [Gammaproteobacteria bacterium]MDC1012803.1 hypothetical protein [Gammaproteobacteria bacterium]